MAKQPSWGSPRSRRDSTNDPEKYAKGSVQTTQEDLGKLTNEMEINDPFSIQDSGFDESKGFDVDQDRSAP
jgi:hypothetical protein